MKRTIQQFPPVYFALVMSTGIISLAAQAQQLTALATGLFYVNLVAYPVLLALLVLRLMLFPRECWVALTSHKDGPAFLALVPATALLGSQFVVLATNRLIGSLLWLLALITWLLVSYSFMLGVSLKKEKPTLEQGLTGSWLLLVVATESLAVLGALLLPTAGIAADVAMVGILGLFLLGSVLYVLLITLIFYRLTFLPLGDEEVGAAYWISVGASAIVVLAGTGVVAAMQHTRALAELLPFVKGYCVLFWAMSTWWLPVVAALRLWNHYTTRPAFAYSPNYWSMVFPLGMYTAATGKLAQSLPVAALHVVPQYFIYLSLAAWVLTFGGMLYHFMASAKSPQQN
ncbi:tellurite resistance/C4-dicarboxylate transporter family protein [Hymenobacter sp. BRD67]|uniref:tellurite resistance/C4-dicarboxylate transporter family protein n=1 Tax=Hymenobacter sp. BRD67 TaxID=2675877 RepID=UPI00156761FE|nr:tellurite resistance/C4-dicarboxylate transporter family protein [Hymenobacter sp. BRD67]QKG51508.1 tellurite resistance/C4-dicarboxylate transporter family protein [Hymenobacter sp. BRD67]